MPAEEPIAPDPSPPSPAVRFAILLNGTSSSGKSSLCRALQSRIGIPLLHASLDTFTDMYAWDAITEPTVKQRCHANGVRNFHQALKSFAAGPHPIVIDHILEQPAWYQATRDALNGLRVYCIGVHCPLGILAAREQSRRNRRPGMAASQFDRVHRGMSYDLEIDTSLETPESGAAIILNFIRDNPPSA